MPYWFVQNLNNTISTIYYDMEDTMLDLIERIDNFMHANEFISHGEMFVLFIFGVMAGMIISYGILKGGK